MISFSSFYNIVLIFIKENITLINYTNYTNRYNYGIFNYINKFFENHIWGIINLKCIIFFSIVYIYTYVY
ncbi:hypothetical protein PFAG_03625 [Plasmodium falciparum Santa Lucia]|uniref:Uncharacterized protein n=5 Tax=Plasmodium falciparum TaxID=5833 RepID=W7KDF7_PLAFO|nr:hypothetical protein PFNF135_03783 [Plasmodium falciparum NF135/5.C10]ETW56327.1 hypothetical protein PFUGPA_01692 [Plasmodium falciparum Palo Alto/Uganda]ETW60566.1 hypothetical protein PFMC_03561 [Plasmodium falciparum CAMP/Malaysia]EUT83229.1 hypothetical protein PFAG_03625 [Plasmodium falciparum Santa Lucia]EWC87677.1 hypothetical protein PFNF54_03525 [Plasmodium falciparum NF54]